MRSVPSSSPEGIVMLKFYYHPTPNSMKVALLLEELGLPYEANSVDIFKGEQHNPAFRQINPNGKVPAIIDDGIAVFDSHPSCYIWRKNTVDLCLEMPPQTPLYYPGCSSWPRASPPSRVRRFTSSTMRPKFCPMRKIATLRKSNVIIRYWTTTCRCLKFLAGAEYSIADMALWSWANSAGYILGDKGLTDYPNLKGLVDRVGARPAMAGVIALRTKHQFKAELDVESRRAMFPQNETKAA
jgi:GST-like protein